MSFLIIWRLGKVLEYAFLSFTLLLLTVGCVFQQTYDEQIVADSQWIAVGEQRALHPGIVLVGVTRLSGLNVPFDNKKIARETMQQLSTQHAIESTPPSITRKLVGDGPHDEMMAFYARHGRLASHQIRRLMASDLPGRLAMIIRLESDDVRRLPFEFTSGLPPQVNHSRESLRFVTRRTTGLSVRLLDLHNGREVWNRHHIHEEDTIVNVPYEALYTSIVRDEAEVKSQSQDAEAQRFYPSAAPVLAVIVTLLKQAVGNIVVKFD